jgi:hypothetical protein
MAVIALSSLARRECHNSAADTWLFPALQAPRLPPPTSSEFSPPLQLFFKASESFSLKSNNTVSPLHLSVSQSRCVNTPPQYTNASGTVG